MFKESKGFMQIVSDYIEEDKPAPNNIVEYFPAFDNDLEID